VIVHALIGRRAGSFVALALLAALVAGCAVRAPYAAPATTPVVLTQAADPAFATQPYDASWWRLFEDPVLERLEAAALTANHDIRQAVARIDQARAIFTDVSRARYPQAGVGASVDIREQAIPGFTSGPIRINTYRAGFDAFWEIDLFGGVRSAVQSAAADAQGFEASLDDVRVSVAAEVARSYFELRGLQQRLAVAERSLTNQREARRLTEVRRDGGVGEEQDVASAAASVAAVEASIPPLRAGLAAARHRIAVLVGVRPSDLTEDLEPRAYAPLMTTLPLGQTGELLRRRPDVRAAERRLAASTAREGVAAADLYPRISVTGALGLLAGRGNLFGLWESRQWAVTPALSWVGTDLGGARARLRGSEAATREVFARYEQTVLRAIEETENALVDYREEQARLERLTEQARQSARSADLARVRYREGLTDFLDLLDAERTQLGAEDAVAQVEATVFTRIVAVYKALGGAEAP
jgi:multidrug efflux system outer membrane protein